MGVKFLFFIGRPTLDPPMGKLCMQQYWADVLHPGNLSGNFPTSYLKKINSDMSVPYIIHLEAE